MKIKEVTEILISLGWIPRKDEVGDRCSIYTLADRFVQIIYDLNKIRDQQKFGAMLSLSTSSFSESCSYIAQERMSYAPLVRAWKGIDIRASEIIEQHIRQASELAIEWANTQDLNKALNDHAALPTDALGARPLWHLAALAALGDIEKLQVYKSNFEAGNRLGFVNYVTTDYIDRALAGR